MPAAISLASPLHRWLLIAAFCALFQSAFLPILGPGVAAWGPTHDHISLNGQVPPHTHPYEEQDGHHVEGLTHCAAPQSALSDPATPADAHVPVVCAPGDEGSTASVALSARHEAHTVSIPLGGFEAEASAAASQAWQSLALPVLTPPPRN